jgi:hypothetical protein
VERSGDTGEKFEEILPDLQDMYPGRFDNYVYETREHYGVMIEKVCQSDSVGPDILFSQAKK